MTVWRCDQIVRSRAKQKARPGYRRQATLQSRRCATQEAGPQITRYEQGPKPKTCLTTTRGRGNDTHSHNSNRAPVECTGTAPYKSYWHPASDWPVRSPTDSRHTVAQSKIASPRGERRDSEPRRPIPQGRMSPKVLAPPLPAQQPAMTLQQLRTRP